MKSKVLIYPRKDFRMLDPPAGFDFAAVAGAADLAAGSFDIAA